MIEQIAESIKEYFDTNEVEIMPPNKIKLLSCIIIEYTSNDKITFTDTNDWYDNVYETNLENLCNDIRKELWI